MKFERARYWFAAKVDLSVWKTRPSQPAEVHTDDSQPSPSPRACELLEEWVVTRQAEVQAGLLKGLFEQRLAYAHWFVTEDDDELAERIEAPEEFIDMLTLRSITVHGLSDDGLPMLGFTFDCPWDDEHGAGFMMKGAQLVELGGSDTAILEWVAEKHAGAGGLLRLP